MAQDRLELVREAMVCTRAEQRFTLGRNLGFRSGFNSNPQAAALPPKIKQQFYETFLRVADQVFSWKQVAPKYEELYLKTYSLKDLLALQSYCRDPRYKQLISKDLEMLPGGFAIGQEFQPILLKRLNHANRQLIEQLSP